MIDLGLSRALAGRELTDTAALYRTTLVPDDAGGQTETETLIASYPCRLQAKANAAERVEGGRVVAVTVWTCYLPFSTDVRPADVLLVNGDRFEVVEDDAARTQGAMTAVSLRRIA